jgi:nucleotide-binding universal stress UspA family protein
MLKILIAIDGSEAANRAIEAVGKMAKSSFQLEATLLCVSPEPVFYGNYSMGTIQRIEEDQKKQQNALLSEATSLARAQGLNLAEPLRAYGVVAHEIVRMALEAQMDQIVMGTRGMGAVGNMLLGSVAQKVIHLSPVPVLLVK